MLTRHAQFERAVNVQNMYGQQECRLTKEEIDSHWNEVLEVIAKVEERGESLIFVTDANRHVGDIVEGNNEKVTYGGELIRKFLESEKYVLLNSTNLVIGGPWTRTDYKDPECKSVLDLVIISSDLVKYVEVMEIDSQRKFTPFRVTKESLHFTDHFAIKVTLQGLPVRKKSQSLGMKYT